MSLVTTILSLVLALLVIVMGLAKTQSLPASTDIRQRLAVSATGWRVWGVVELIAAGCLVVGVFAATALAVAAAGLIALCMFLLLLLQLRVRDPIAFLTPTLVLLALVVADIVLLITLDG